MVVYIDVDNMPGWEDYDALEGKDRALFDSAYYVFGDYCGDVTE